MKLWHQTTCNYIFCRDSLLQGIVRYLTLIRLKVLKDNGATEFYYIVDANNFNSLKMHREFGFVEIDRAEGFLHIKHENSDGYLFRISL